MIGSSSWHSHAERRAHQQQVAQERRDGLQRHLKDQHLAAVHSLSDLRVEGLRQQREHAAIRQEMLMDHSFIQSEQAKARKQARAELEDKFSAELLRRRILEARETAQRQRIIDGSEELRALRGKLNAASVNKVRAMQMLEHQAQLDVEEQRESAYASQLRDQMLQEEELEVRLESAKSRQHKNVMQIQQQQMLDKERLQLDEQQRTLAKEQAHVQQLMANLQAEDEEVAALRYAKRSELQQGLRSQVAERAEQEATFAKQENMQRVRDEAFCAERERREVALQRRKEEQEIERRRRVHALIQTQEIEQAEAKRLEEVRQVIHEEEINEAQRRRDEFQARVNLEKRAELKQAYLYHRITKDQRAQQWTQELQREREALMAKLAEEDLIEQMSSQKRRMKVAQHHRQVEEQLRLRRQKYEDERQLELEEQQRAAGEEEMRQQVIEAERQRLLTEHAAPLRDFLPKGVAKQESDLQLLGATPASRSFQQAWATPPGTPAPGFRLGPVIKQSVLTPEKQLEATVRPTLPQLEKNSGTSCQDKGTHVNQSSRVLSSRFDLTAAPAAAHQSLNRSNILSTRPW